MSGSQKRRLVACAITAIACCIVAGTPAHASQKKGMDLSTNDPLWRKKLAESNVTWYYTWGQERPMGAPAGLEFVPMAWGGYAAEHLNVPYGSTFLLGFNEPDQKDQSKMTVDQAINYWPTLEQGHGALGSPATAWMFSDWMTDFMKQADEKHYRVDFITVHFYGGPGGTWFLQQIDKLWQTYHRPIWITELGIAQWEATKDKPTIYSVDTVKDFMKTVLDGLEARPYVQRYCWFPADESSYQMGTSALFHKDGTLTDLGKLYASY
ncbi:MAG: glycosyl hydrolase [Capsulimonadaceae bacterium]